MSLTPAIYSVVTKLAPSVGSVLNVIDSFQDPNYIAAGSKFDPVLYPKLAAQVTPSFNADRFKRIVHPGPTNAFSHLGGGSNAATALGTICFTFEYENDFYVISTLGHIHKCVGGLQDYPTASELKIKKFTYVGSLPLESGNIQASQCSIANGRFYYYTTAPTPATYFVPLNNLLATPTKLTFVVGTGAVPSQTAKVKYGQGRYNCIFVGGTSVGATSTDGITFSTFSINPGNFSTTDIEYGETSPGVGTWVVTTSGTAANNVATSSDGVTFTARTGAALAIKTVVYSPALNLFVAVPSTAAAFQTSTDGVSWTARAQAGTAAIMNAATVLAGGIIVFSSAGSIQYSSNGTTFTQLGNSTFYAPLAQTTNNLMLAGTFVGVNNDRAVIFGTPGNSGVYHYIYAKEDILDVSDNITPYRVSFRTSALTKAPVFIANNLYGLADEFWFGRSPATAGPEIMLRRTVDGGETWEPVLFKSKAEPTLLAICRKILAGTSKFVLMTNGFTNTDSLSGNPRFAAIDTQVAGQFLTPGVLDYATIQTAPAAFAPALTVMANDVIYASAGSVTTYYTSADFGATWTSRSSNVTPNMVMTIGKYFFLIGGTSTTVTIWPSADLLTPGATVGTFPTTAAQTLPGITYTGGGTGSGGTYGIFALNTSANAYVTFDNGVSWSVKTLPVTFNSANMSFQVVNNWFMLYTGYGYMYRSRDGATWELVNVGLESEPIQQWNDVSNTPDGKMGFVAGAASQNGYFLKTDNSYSIPSIQSTPGLKWVIKAK